MRPLSSRDPSQVGPYRVFAELGHGAMGRVLLGAGPDGRTVAIKVIHSWLAGNEEFQARFIREVDVSNRVSGAYTAAVLNAGSDDGTPWLASEFLLGPTLRSAIDTAGPLPELAVLRLAAGLSSALNAIHGTGTIHRDIKPSNIILAADGPRIIDFGIAHLIDDATNDITHTGQLIGTPAFMSPEQARSKPLSPASDVFSLGSTLAMAATAKSPFTAASPYDLQNKVAAAEADLTGVSDRVRAIVEPCLALRPDDRPTPSEVLALIGNVTPSAHPWPDRVAALADEQQRELKRFFDDAGERTTVIDNGRTMVTDPEQPTWNEAPGGGADPTASPTEPSPKTPQNPGAASPRSRTAIAAQVLALLCIPGLLYFLYIMVTLFSEPGAPIEVFLVNMAVSVTEIVLLIIGTRLLFLRKSAGIRVLVITGSVIALQSLSASIQSTLTGGNLTVGDPLWLTVYLYAPVTAGLALASVISARQPSTRRWCLG